QPALDAPAADRLPIQATAVVGNFKYDFRAFATHRNAHGALVGLAGVAARTRFFEAVSHRVAEHVLQRRGHALEHVAVEFALGSVEPELGVLAGFGCRLADHAAQARHQRVEGHHARAHEAFLQVGADPRL